MENNALTPDEWFDQVNKKFTPAREQQLVAILAGECPHNRGFNPYGLYQIKPLVYKCALCGDIKFL